jgi:transposase-like protein
MANHFCRGVRENHEDSPLPEQGLPSIGKTVCGNLIRFGFYQTRWGKRRRYRSQTCNKTFCSKTGTPYNRLQHRRATLDQVATLSVEGLNKSAIARGERIGWNTVDRWLEKASDCGRRFNDEEITGFRATEVQADEIRTIIQGKQRPTFVFCSHRGLVPTLVFNRGRQTQLPKHVGPVSRYC